MMMRLSSLMTVPRSLAAVVLTVLIAAGPVRAGSPDPCRFPEDAAGTVSVLPQVSAVLKPGGHLRVLAVGSATMFGPDASLAPGTLTSQTLNNVRPIVPQLVPSGGAAHQPEASEQAFPRMMAKALEAQTPGLVVEVVFRGGRGFTAGDMLAQMHEALAGGKFQLVLWQTGTVEAVRNTPPGEFAEVLSNGAAEVESAGANLILIDPQFSRFLQTNSNLDPYTQALVQTASMPGVGLFRRYDLMRIWANEGQIDLERTPRADRRRMVQTLHACLGAALARMVSAGAHT